MSLLDQLQKLKPLYDALGAIGVIAAIAFPLVQWVTFRSDQEILWAQEVGSS